MDAASQKWLNQTKKEKMVVSYFFYILSPGCSVMKLQSYNCSFLKFSDNAALTLTDIQESTVYICALFINATLHFTSICTAL